MKSGAPSRPEQRVVQNEQIRLWRRVTDSAMAGALDVDCKAAADRRLCERHGCCTRMLAWDLRRSRRIASRNVCVSQVSVAPADFVPCSTNPTYHQTQIRNRHILPQTYNASKSRAGQEARGNGWKGRWRQVLPRGDLLACGRPTTHRSPGSRIRTH